MADVRAILAIGLRGQLGLNGHLPWEGATDRAFKDDVARFFQVTRGHVLIAGPRTVATVPPAATADRTVVAIRSADTPEDVIAQFGDRIIYIGGGPAVWRSYAHHIRHWDITRLPYDGPAAKLKPSRSVQVDQARTPAAYEDLPDIRVHPLPLVRKE
jgi:dihydromethanopterin reductase